MRSKNVPQPAAHCPRYVKTIEAQFERAKVAKDTMFSLKEFCDMIANHAEVADYVAIVRHSHDGGEL